jgi:uncharacterized protein YggE
MTWGGLVQGQHVSIDAAVRGSDKPYVLAMGEATISVEPDQAIIDVGVVTASCGRGFGALASVRPRKH